MKRTPIKIKTEKKCKVCGKKFIPFKTTDKYCSPICAKKDNGTPKIKPQSEKMKGKMIEYREKRKAFLARLENKYCFIVGCNNLADTIEHTRGRTGKNLLDESTWRPCCWRHNIALESDTVLSEKYQFSKFHEGKKIKK